MGCERLIPGLDVCTVKALPAVYDSGPSKLYFNGV